MMTTMATSCCCWVACNRLPSWVDGVGLAEGEGRGTFDHQPPLVVGSLDPYGLLQDEIAVEVGGRPFWAMVRPPSGTPQFVEWRLLPTMKPALLTR